MKKMVNSVRLSGYLYESKLEKKVSGPNSKNPGTEFISGSIGIATDDELLNIVTVHYSYVVEATKNGGVNNTFIVLNNIIDGKIGTVMANGKEKAAKVRVDTSLALNDFYTDCNGTTELVSAKRNEGGFIHLTDVLSDNPEDRNGFAVDAIITGAIRKEADEEKNLPEKMIIKCSVFDFRGSLLPMEFTVLKPGAMDYFESLGISQTNPLCIKLKGTQVSTTVVRKIEEESAWGDVSVREVRNTRKDMVIDWAAPEAYTWDDESFITAVELTEAVAARETYLATVKQRNDEYKASKAQPVAAPAKGAFNF